MKKGKLVKIADDEIRIMKIGKKAIFELLYETIMGEQERLYNVDLVKGLACFDIDFDSGQFIFCVTDFAELEKTNKLDFIKIK